MRRFWMASIGCAAMVGMACSTPALSAEPAQAPAEETPAAALAFTYTGDIWSVTSGGSDRDMVYIDNLDLQLSLDLERLVGWNGTQAFFYALYNNGNSVSELSSDLNGISNIETGVEAIRLYEAWIDHSFAEGKGSVRLGLYDLNSEFDAGEVRSLFLNPGHGIGTDYAQSGQNGPSIFPVTSLAVRVNYQFEGDVYLRGTIADGVPGNPGHPKRTTIDLKDGDGLLLAAETGIARDDRLWSIGGWAYTEEADDLVDDAQHTNFGGYIALEERLMSADKGDSFNLSGSVRLGMANEDVNPISTFFSATVVATGLIPAWPEDQIGLGFLMSNGSDKFLSLIDDPEDHEINIELTYFTNLTENITIQPDIQWVISPGLDGSVEDVFVFGLRLSVNKNWSLD
jgi:porin